MLKSDRQQIIVEEVLANGTMSVTDLSERFQVSEITIRRDLDELDEAGYLQRVRGGVRRPSPKEPEPPIIQRQKASIAEKKEIAEAAAALVSEGEMIALEMGTTSLELARALAQKSWKNLHVVSNGIPILFELSLIPGIRLISIGGVVDTVELSCLGYFSEQFLAQLNISKLFLGCRAIDSEHGITNTIQAEKEIGIVRAFVESSARVIVLADHTKFNQVFPVQVLAPSEIDVIVTDTQTSENDLKKFREKNILIHSIGKR